MAATATPGVTVEQYARMLNPEDGTRDELIEGEVVYRPIPGGFHGVCCGNASFPLHDYAKRTGGTATIGSGVIVGRTPDSVLGPDVAYWPTRFSREIDWPDVPPAAVFEIVDHDEPYHYIHRKIPLYRRFGVGVLWVVSPFCDSVTEYRADSVRLFSIGDDLDGGSVLPGFSCQVADLFA